MKKRYLFLLIVICIFVSGCGSNKTKEVATLDKFESIVMNIGFTMNDVSKSYNKVDYILGAKKASYGEITIEMIKYTTDDYASKVQDGQIESFNSRKSTGATAIKEKGANYYKYALVSNGRYMISIRVGDTLIFGNVLLKDKETVDKVINSLNY